MAKKDQSTLGYFYIIVGLVLFLFGAGALIFRFLVGFLGLFLIDYGFKLNRWPSIFDLIARLIKAALSRD